MKINWKDNWGILQDLNSSVATLRLFHYKHLFAYEGNYHWKKISYEQYKSIRTGKEAIEKIWLDLSLTEL